MSKKILSIVLALTLALSCFAVSAFAIGEIGYEEEGSTYTQAWSLSEAQEDADGNWYVEVSLTANYKVGAMQFALDISSADITIADVVAGDAITGDYNADIAFDTTGNSNIVAIIPNPVEDAAEAVDASDGIVVCTVYFAVANDATGTVQIVDNAKSSTNPGGTLFAARIEDGILATGTAITGQATTIETPVRNIGAVAAPAELVLTATGASKGVVIDNTHTFGGAYAGVVYGITATTYKTKANITNNVEASNGGSLVVKSSDGKTTASGNFGTGSTIEVLNADGTSTGKVYVFVVFGDVDGNGLINVSDSAAAAAAISNASNAPNNSVKRMAANCQLVAAAAMMHTLNTNDVKAISGHVGGTKLDQVALATKMASLTGTYYK